ncbi:hypothetical protein KUCAC02_009919 [Chaenocephalus aceratus]|uniref:Uncharacterized protein n=1 Tax=Chaenocephalus aceratus TaxID=36190 RepID=A0ACB9VZ09_CHAAC|nr:hypothetical protein KUCAC02_009919 [Chaenocephalus aceratus]
MWESGANRRHLNRHETHFQWDTNPHPLSQQRAVLQCQPGAHSTGMSFLREHRQAFRSLLRPIQTRGTISRLPTSGLQGTTGFLTVSVSDN